MHRAALGLAGLVFLLFLSCSPYNIAHHSVRTAEYGNPASEKRVLIATQGSDFKDVLVKGVTDSLVAHGAHVRVVDIRKLPKASSPRYDAYFIVYALQVGTEQRQAREFVERGEYGDRTVVVRTQGEFSDVWPPAREDVDAVTAASKQDELAPLIERMSGSLGAILER